MPLPTEPRAVWPPKTEHKILRDVNQWAAWYSGEPARLSTAADQQPLSPSERIRFWANRGRTNTGRPKQRDHLPLAGDIATKSAALLFGEPVDLTVPSDTDGANPTQERLDELRDLLGLDNELLEAAEVCAGLGGVYLRPVWDKDIADHPLATSVHPDQAVPDFRFGRLAAVTFWEEVGREGNIVWRHLERYEPGVILHGLYEGDKERLGRSVDLGALPSTKGYEEALTLQGPLADRLLPVYVPNMRPNKRHRTSSQGQADIAGDEGLLDNLDEAWTSWMRDLRLGAARLMIPQQYLSGGGGGQGGTFDLDQDLMVKYNADPTAMGAATGIEQVQFEIRTEAHAATVTKATATIVTSAGYSPETFGIHESGPADSGRALKIRQGDTFRTKARKEGYFRSPVATFVETLLAIDRQEFGRQQVEPVRPTVTFADGIVDDARERAETVQLLAAAQAMSVRMRVKMAQPELDGDDLENEVAAILSEQGMTVPDPMQEGALA